jgi:hypothetical protein
MFKHMRHLGMPSTFVDTCEHRSLIHRLHYPICPPPPST